AFSLSATSPYAFLRTVLLNFVSAHRHCVAHILLSRTYKSNNFSRLFTDSGLIAQMTCNPHVLPTKRVIYQQ
ncbi:hypothetical protein, partial [Pantoea dispersa]|uniref:hypothetical protein n=1 Tax=Pantoea dispersa TaxID=59814 RepID=UPI0019D32473